MKKNKVICPKCTPNVELKEGVAVINNVGKVNSKGEFIPAHQVFDGETIYPVASQVSMVTVDKCPKCGFSILHV